VKFARNVMKVYAWGFIDPKYSSYHTLFMYHVMSSGTN